eukprot:415092-Rhodomonas_salina.2
MHTGRPAAQYSTITNANNSIRPGRLRLHATEISLQSAELSLRISEPGLASLHATDSESSSLHATGLTRYLPAAGGDRKAPSCWYYYYYYHRPRNSRSTS